MHTQHPTRHEFKGLTDWIEVMTAGAHTDSKGQACNISQADLQQMAANHALGAAPAVLGHPKHDDPAYAWVDGYKVEGNTLFAKFCDINPDFETGVKTGAYRNRSLSVYKDPVHGLRVRHVGWLGAVLPAIDGLKPVNFSAPEAECMEFAMADDVAYAVDVVAQMLRGLREQMIADKGLDAANATFPEWQLGTLTDAAARLRIAPEDGDVNPLFSKPVNPEPTGGDMSFSQAQLDEAAAAAAATAEAATRAQFAAQGLELAELQALRRRETIDGVITAAKAAGKLLPAMEPGLAEFMASLDSASAEFTFSKGAGEVKKTPMQFFHDFMAALPVQVQLGKKIGDDKGDALDKNNAQAIAAAAQDFQASELKAGRTIAIEVAVSHVMASL